MKISKSVASALLKRSSVEETTASLSNRGRTESEVGSALNQTVASGMIAIEAAKIEPFGPGSTHDPLGDGADVLAEDTNEGELAERIQKLWKDHSATANLMKRSKTEKDALRSELAASLHKMKFLVSRKGKNGGWHSYLRDNNLNRNSADRWVKAHEQKLSMVESNCPTGAITPPTPSEQLTALAHKLAPKLAKLPLTPELIEHLLLEIRTVATFTVVGDRSRAKS